MSQSRRASTIETVTNVGTGYVLAIVVQLLVYPLYGVHVDIAGQLEIGLIFTAVSIVRGYVFRRLFNRFTNKSRTKTI